MATLGGGSVISNDVLETRGAVKRLSASRSSLITGIAAMVVAVSNYAFTTVMAWLLPLHEFGIFGLVQSCLFTAAALLNAGFTWELARVIAQGVSRTEAFRIAKSAFVGILTIALVLDA